MIRLAEDQTKEAKTPHYRSKVYTRQQVTGKGSQGTPA
jgi:hypothetical protein